MKKMLFFAAAVASLGGSAFAADMPMKARPIAPPPAFSWTGFYIGGIVGDARQKVTNTYSAPGLPDGYFAADQAVIDAFSSNNFSSSRVTGGAEVGYNIQFGGLVVGAEFDIDYLGFSNTLTTAFTAPLAGPVVSTTQSSTNWMFTARGRLGWAVFERLLVYGTGGIAAVHSTLTETNVYSPVFVASGTDFSSISAPYVGWVAGGGLEYAITDHWSIKGEYLHVGLPSKTAGSGTASPFFGDPNLVSYNHTVTNEIDIGRFGINYRF
jgi:outer membrane immunogenic protein